MSIDTGEIFIKTELDELIIPPDDPIEDNSKLDVKSETHIISNSEQEWILENNNQKNKSNFKSHKIAKKITQERAKDISGMYLKLKILF